MSFATDWQAERVEIRCPCCNRHICTEAKRSPKPEAVLFFPVNPDHAKQAETVIRCRGCKELLEIRRPREA